MAIQPISIPSGGLEQMNLRLTGVRELTAAINLSEEEIAQIVARRPTLLSSYTPEQRTLLSSYSTAELASIDGSNGNSSEEEIADNSVSESTKTVDSPADNVPEVIENESDDTENEPGSSASEGVQDYSQLSLDDLLNELQADYSSAREDIESSDMSPVDMAQAKIDLNKAAVQEIEQDILLTKYSSDYSNSEIKQNNVSAMENLVEELKTEMLTIAKESEVSEEEVADAISESESQNALQAISENSGISDQIDAHYVELANINSDTSTSPIVQLSSRMKQHVGFVAEVEAERDEAIQESGEESARVLALNDLISQKEQEIGRDIDAWEQESGAELTEAEKILASSDETYIAKRSILESQNQPEAINALNFETAQALLNDNSTSDGVSFNLSDDENNSE